MSGLIPKTQIFLRRNGSTILTFMGAIGVIASAVSAAKASPKASYILEKAKDEKGEKLTIGETIKIAGPAYIPTVLICTATISCIFGSNAINKNSQAALLSAYTLLDSSYKEYKNKVIETLGKDTDEQIIKDISKDHYRGPKERTPGKQVFMDFNSLSIFESTVEEIEAAEAFINELIEIRGYALVSEYEEFLGITAINSDYRSGWSDTMLKALGVNKVELTLYKSETKDNDDYYLVGTSVPPSYDDCWF